VGHSKIAVCDREKGIGGDQRVMVREGSVPVGYGGLMSNGEVGESYTAHPIREVIRAQSTGWRQGAERNVLSSNFE
jgi:hypothetical protein